MTDVKDKIRKIQRVIDDPKTHPNIRKNAEAAKARLTTALATMQVIRAKVLADHQRRAWLCIVDGAGRLSKAENSFLHNIRERRIQPTSSQMRWLGDLELRIAWEKSL